MVTFARQWHRGVALPFFGKVESVTSNAFSMRTARLELRAATLEHLEAELEGPERLKNLLGADVLPSWPPGEYDRFAVAYFRDRLAEGGEAVAVWYVWYAILTATSGSPSPSNGEVGVASSPSILLRRRSVSLSNPVPTLPAYTRFRPR